MSDKKVKTTDKTPKVNDAPKAKVNGEKSKVAVKTKDVVTNTIKNAKDIAKDAVVKKAVQSKLGTEKDGGEPQKVDSEAATNVENTAYAVGGAVYNKAKNFTKNRISDIKDRVKSKENEEEQPDKDEPDNEKTEKDENGNKKNNKENSKENEPKQKDKYENKDDNSLNKPKDKSDEKQGEKPKVKTKEEYLKSQKNTNESSASKGVKTKENYLKKEMNDAKVEPDKSALDARKDYVSKKLKEKSLKEKASEQEYRPDTEIKNTSVKETYDTKIKEKALNTADVKTKDNYIKSLQGDKSNLVKSHYNNKPKSKLNESNRIRSNVTTGKKTVASVKKGSVYNGTLSKSKSVKVANKATKTQREAAKRTAKKAAKEAAKRAKQASARAAKSVAEITKAIATAITKAAAAFFAAFGWVGVVIVLIILLVVIVAAAIAKSPFGIFFSHETGDVDSIPVSSIVNECNMELSQKLTDIEDRTVHDRIVMEGEQADWNLVLALFSVKVAGKDDDSAQDVVIIDEGKKQKLKEVFWDMHSISSRTESAGRGDTTQTTLYITITAKTKEQMISQYSFTGKQKEALETLLENSSTMTASIQSLVVSDTTAQEVIDNLPNELSEERKRVVKKACSLVGKLTYFWGGKSEVIGWDSEWGKMKLVTSEGSRSSGCMRPFGLDCSGFVTWSFVNAGFSSSAIGHGTLTQVGKGTRISLSFAQPGDLAFYDDKSHVGIVGGKDSNGNILVIHCSSGANNVVITTGGFGFAVRPNCY